MQNKGQTQLVIRRFDELETTLLSQNNANAPFFSPDGAWVGFNDVGENTIKRVSRTGGPALAIASAGSARMYGATWGENGTIIFGNSLPSGLWQVEAGGGGTPKPLTTVDQARGEINHSWPELLPGDEAILFTIEHAEENPATDEIAVRNLRTGEQRILVTGGSYPRYAASGHIVYAFAGTLRAVPFDLDKLTVTGDPVAVLENVATKVNGGAEFALAANGTLMYATGTAAGASTQLAWVDFQGRREPLDVPPGRYANPRISPDGRWLVYEREDSGEVNVWLCELSTGGSPRKLTEGGNNRYPTWSRDGRYVVFQSDRDGDQGLFWQQADGSSPAERLTKPEPGTAQIPESWSPTADRLAFSSVTGDSVELWLWNLEDRTAVQFPGVEAIVPFNAAFSPDGQWVAYTERRANGTTRIYVQAVPPATTRYQAGTDEEVDHHPLWAPDGSRLFYFPAVNQLVSVTVRLQPTFAFGPPIPLPGDGLPANTSALSSRNHDIAPDGSRFIAALESGNVQGSQTGQSQIIVVQNWLEELKQRVPVR